MAKRATSTTTTATPATEPPKTPADRLAELERNLAMFADIERRKLAEVVAKQQEACAAVAAAIEASNDGDAGYRVMKTHWGMEPAAIAAGMLTALHRFRACLENLKEEHEPAEALREFRDMVHQTALEDTDRGQSSTCPYSNALEMHAGDGRGRVYRDVARMVASVLRKIEQA